MKKITLRPKRDQAVRRYHPWIFSGAIRQMEGEPTDGDVVAVFDHQQNYLATGFYQDGSIAVRLISFEDRAIDEAFWIEKIGDAFRLRQRLQLTDNDQTNCYRLIHAEGDGLPGLIIDIYGKTAVVQCHAIGMHRHRELIAAAIQSVLGQRIDAVFDKSHLSLPDRYAQQQNNGYLIGEAQPDPVLENSHRFFVDWERGQKTGFFLDQRENRQLLSRYTVGKRVLNAFCYSGGFSIYAMAAGAASVTSVDVSKKAIDWTLRNLELNNFDAEQHPCLAKDVMTFLKEDETTYEVMVVDPPAFAKNLKKRHQAVQGYIRLNAMAIKRLEKNGILFTFSCSQVVDTLLFENSITAAALEAGRKARILHRLNQPADHPVSLFHPEGAYLKGLVLQLD